MGCHTTRAVSRVLVFKAIVVVMFALFGSQVSASVTPESSWAPPLDDLCPPPPESRLWIVVDTGIAHSHVAMSVFISIHSHIPEEVPFVRPVNVSNISFGNRLNSSMSATMPTTTATPVPMQGTIMIPKTTCTASVCNKDGEPRTAPSTEPMLSDNDGVVGNATQKSGDTDEGPRARASGSTHSVPLAETETTSRVCDDDFKERAETAFAAAVDLGMAEFPHEFDGTSRREWCRRRHVYNVTLSIVIESSAADSPMFIYPNDDSHDTPTAHAESTASSSMSPCLAAMETIASARAAEIREASTCKGASGATQHATDNDKRTPASCPVAALANVEFHSLYEMSHVIFRSKAASRRRRMFKSLLKWTTLNYHLGALTRSDKPRGLWTFIDVGNAETSVVAATFRDGDRVQPPPRDTLSGSNGQDAKGFGGGVGGGGNSGSSETDDNGNEDDDSRTNTNITATLRFPVEIDARQLQVSLSTFAIGPSVVRDAVKRMQDMGGCFSDTLTVPIAEEERSVGMDEGVDTKGSADTYLARDNDGDDVQSRGKVANTTTTNVTKPSHFQTSTDAKSSESDRGDVSGCDSDGDRQQDGHDCSGDGNDDNEQGRHVNEQTKAPASTTNPKAMPTPTPITANAAQCSNSVSRHLVDARAGQMLKRAVQNTDGKRTVVGLEHHYRVLLHGLWHGKDLYHAIDHPVVDERNGAVPTTLQQLQEAATSVCSAQNLTAVAIALGWNIPMPTLSPQQHNATIERRDAEERNASSELGVDNNATINATGTAPPPLPPKARTPSTTRIAFSDRDVALLTDACFIVNYAAAWVSLQHEHGITKTKSSTQGRNDGGIVRHRGHGGHNPHWARGLPILLRAALDRPGYNSEYVSIELRPKSPSLPSGWLCRPNIADRSGQPLTMFFSAEQRCPDSQFWRTPGDPFLLWVPMGRHGPRQFVAPSPLPSHAVSSPTMAGRWGPFGGQHVSPAVQMSPLVFTDVRRAWFTLNTSTGFLRCLDSNADSAFAGSRGSTPIVRGGYVHITDDDNSASGSDGHLARKPIIYSPHEHNNVSARAQRSAQPKVDDQQAQTSAKPGFLEWVFGPSLSAPPPALALEANTLVVMPHEPSVDSPSFILENVREYDRAELCKRIPSNGHFDTIAVHTAWRDWLRQTASTPASVSEGSSSDGNANEDAGDAADRKLLRGMVALLTTAFSHDCIVDARPPMFGDMNVSQFVAAARVSALPRVSPKFWNSTCLQSKARFGMLFPELSLAQRWRILTTSFSTLLCERSYSRRLMSMWRDDAWSGVDDVNEWLLEAADRTANRLPLLTMATGVLTGPNITIFRSRRNAQSMRLYWLKTLDRASVWLPGSEDRLEDQKVALETMESLEYDTRTSTVSAVSSAEKYALNRQALGSQGSQSRLFVRPHHIDTALSATAQRHAAIVLPCILSPDDEWLQWFSMLGHIATVFKLYMVWGRIMLFIVVGIRISLFVVSKAPFDPITLLIRLGLPVSCLPKKRRKKLPVHLVQWLGVLWWSVVLWRVVDISITLLACCSWLRQYTSHGVGVKDHRPGDLFVLIAKMGWLYVYLVTAPDCFRRIAKEFQQPQQRRVLDKTALTIQRVTLPLGIFQIVHYSVFYGSFVLSATLGIDQTAALAWLHQLNWWLMPTAVSVATFRLLFWARGWGDASGWGRLDTSWQPWGKQSRMFRMYWCRFKRTRVGALLSAYTVLIVGWSSIHLFIVFACFTYTYYKQHQRQLDIWILRVSRARKALRARLGLVFHTDEEGGGGGASVGRLVGGQRGMRRKFTGLVANSDADVDARLRTLAALPTNTTSAPAHPAIKNTLPLSVQSTQLSPQHHHLRPSPNSSLLMATPSSGLRRTQKQKLSRMGCGC